MVPADSRGSILAKLLSRFDNATRKDNLGKLTAVQEMLKHFEISPYGGLSMNCQAHNLKVVAHKDSVRIVNI